MRRILLVGIAIVPGLAAVAVCAYFLFHDWSALSRNWAQFENAAAQGAEMRDLFIVEARQNAFRLNCFADGVGVLLGAVLAAIGVHGLDSGHGRRPDPGSR